MSAQFEGRRYALELKQRESRIKGIFLLVVVGLILVVAIYDVFIYKLPLNQDLKNGISIIAIAAVFFGVEFLQAPLQHHDKAFFEIVETIKLLEKPGRTPSINKRAYRKIMNAYKKLQLVKIRNRPWYSSIREIERDFYNNIKSRIAPAIIEDKISTTNLIDIALALQNSNIENLMNINDALEKQLEPKETTERNMKDFLTSLYNTTSGKIILSFLIGIGTSTIFIYIGSFMFNLSFLTVIKTNMVSFVALCIGSSIAIIAILLRINQ